MIFLFLLVFFQAKVMRIKRHIYLKIKLSEEYINRRGSMFSSKLTMKISCLLTYYTLNGWCNPKMHYGLGGKENLFTGPVNVLKVMIKTSPKK